MNARLSPNCTLEALHPIRNVLKVFGLTVAFSALFFLSMSSQILAVPPPPR